jgi:hypothetical protein
MRRFWTLILFLTIPLSACGGGGAAVRTAVPTALSLCGDGFCTAGEDALACPQDCPAPAFSGEVRTTYIQSENIGEIAVMIASPLAARYEEGAGIVVIVSPIFTIANAFLTDPDITSLGLIQVSYLWPGQSDDSLGVRSEGVFDYGGEQSIQVLRDVTRFATGRIPDTKGRYINSLTKLTALTEEVGLYAFSDAGLAAVNMFSAYSSQLQGVEYYIGRENPTVDTLTCLEIGYRNDAGEPVYNPFYLYPASYSPSAINLDYNSLRWDPEYVDIHTNFRGRPYLDLDGNGEVSAADYVFSWHVPIMSGKRYYSSKLTHALLDNGILAAADWPATLATPLEADQAWQSRQITPDRFVTMLAANPGLDIKVMLVFAIEDQLQVVPDKPHIHQAYQGFRFSAGYQWVRLNPDRAYVQSLLPGAGSKFPDNPANDQPQDWTQISAYAYPAEGAAGRAVPLAAVAEMADRAHTGRWDENLGRPFFTFSPATPTP